MTLSGGLRGGDLRAELLCGFHQPGQANGSSQVRDAGGQEVRSSPGSVDAVIVRMRAAENFLVRRIRCPGRLEPGSAGRFSVHLEAVDGEDQAQQATDI